MAATSGNYRLGPDNGRVVLKTGRQGIAARAGHDLTIEVTRWSAQVQVPDEDAGGINAATVKAEFDLGSLQVREGTGGAKPLSDRDRGEIKKQVASILGTGTATFTSAKIVRFGSSGGAVEGTFSLNGQSEPVRLQVSEPGPGRYRGSATVVQTALGIKPYVGFFGALKLKDEVGVEFEVSIPAADPA
ncbi:MAG: YceI family protein [Streptosporangiaceae bacterium]